MIHVRRFCDRDAEETAAVISDTLKISNSADYSEEIIEFIRKSHSPERLIEQAKEGHFYVACDEKKIIGCGGIAGYGTGTDESFIMTVFVLPQYQNQGIGRKIIKTLEEDGIFLRSKRTEISSSITACEFYKKLGYSYKGGITAPDEHGGIRMEKFR